MHFLDTSILTSYYCPEARTAAIQRELSRLRNPVISPLVKLEFHCAVARKVRSGALALADARRIISEFDLHLREPRFISVEVREGDYDQAQHWVAQMAAPLRAMDALHLAVASSGNLTLLTADEALAASAKKFGVKCRFIK